MRYIPFIFLMLCLIAPASAETKYFDDSDGHDHYGICADVYDYRPMGSVYGFSYLDPVFGNTDSNYVENSAYNTFVASDDDTFEYMDFRFRPEQSFSLPVTLWYPDGNEEQLNISVEFLEEVRYIFFQSNIVKVTVSDISGNIVVTKTYEDLFDNYCRVFIDDTGIYISTYNVGISQQGYSSLNRYIDTSVNISVFPLTAASFDLTALENVSSYCVIRVIDEQVAEDPLGGWLGWIYEKVDFLDPNMVLYNLLVYVNFIFNILYFVVTFFLFSTWSYIILVNVFALFYGILHSNRGVYAMIRGYMTGMYLGLYFPIMIFTFIVRFIISLVSLIVPL